MLLGHLTSDGAMEKEFIGVSHIKPCQTRLWNAIRPSDSLGPVELCNPYQHRVQILSGGDGDVEKEEVGDDGHGL